MFHIESLLIQGIRSYSPKQHQIIDFDQPITVIHGKNGTGKTTVIESLNYVISNELPPGTKMCSFVNDPKVSGNSDVRAQVKLKFVDCNNLKCVVTRSMTSAVKSNGKVESKSLEGTLLCYADENDQSQRSSVSSRSADLTSAMLSHLSRDISLALLNNVIFCHQENASWPLSEGKNLKEKFDAIFSASKYIGVMDSVKKVKKDEVVSKIKQSKVELVHLEERKKKANTLMNSLNGYVINYDDLSEQLAKIENSYNDTYGEFVDIEKMCDTVKNSFDEIKDLESKMDHVSKLLGDSFSEDVDVGLLKAEQDELLFNMEFNRNEVFLQKESLLILANQHEEVCKNLKSLSEEVCRCTVEKEIFTKNFNSIKEILLEFGVIIEDVDDLKKKVHSLNDELETELNAINYENFEVEGQVEVVEQEKNKINEQLNQVENTHKHLGNSLNLCFEELNFVKDKIQSLKDNNIEKNLDSCKNQHESVCKQINVVVGEIENLEKKMDSAKTQKIHLLEQLNSVEKYNELLNEINAIKDSIHQIEGEIALVGGNINIDASIEERAREMDYLKKSIEMELNELNELKENQQEMKTKMDNFFNETRHHHEYASTEQAIVELNKILSQVERKILKKQTLCSLLVQQNVVSKENDNCPVCERNFDNIDDKKKFFKKVKLSEVKLQELIQRKNRLVNTLSIISVDFGEVDETDYLPLIRDKTEELEIVQTDLNNLIKNVETFKKINTLTERKQFFNENLTQKNAKLNEFKSNFELNNNMNEIKEKIKKNENNILSLSKLINSKKDEKNTLVIRQNELNNEIIKFAEEDKNLYLFNTKKVELDEKTQNLNVEIAHVVDLTKETTLQKEKITQKFDDILAKKRAASNKLALFKEKYNKLEKVNQLQKELNNNKTNLKKVADLIKNQENLSQTKKNIDEKIKASNSTIETLTEQTNEYNDHFNRNSKLFSLIEHKQLLDKLKKEHTEKKQSFAQGKNLTEMNLLLNAKRSELDSYMQDKQYIKGQMAALLEQITDLKLQCETSFYCDADFDYMKKLAALKICEGVQNDLDLYYKALDYAIMEFHSIKMKEINRIIKHYWKMTYCGSDIDTIEIRSEHTDKAVDKVTKSQLRKVYNYKVVILSKDRQVALEMKDKCSAGQKMLASIIIRLALARAFCADLGVLTLDEPTTNLDKDNVITLADALKKLVKSSTEEIDTSKRGGGGGRARGLQLIVITHDKDFVCRLGRSMLTHYYKVDKDLQGCSQVERLPIADLLE